MQYCKYLIIAFWVMLPCALSAQDITGLWKGTIYNDTTKQYYKYEIGISEEKGKLSGFSHTWFILDDKEYYGVKKLKIRKADDGKIVIEDDKLIANNYPEAPPKGVRQLSVLTLEIEDSILKLTGPFTTNRTKKYSSLTGYVDLSRKNDYRQSALVPHLQELNLSDELSFVARDNEPQAETVKSLRQSREPVQVISNEKTASQKRSIPARKKPDSLVTTALNKPRIAGSDSMNITGSGGKLQSATKEVLPAAEMDKRKTIIQQTVFFRSDSLQISLYDNGEVDGDTVSVLINGNLLMGRQGLSTNAIRKTIYTAQYRDSIQLLMYAETLGSIAPNTGLLVVKDGKDIYEIRFSGDLQKSAAIILKRKQ